eukprot:Anaeramoba_ignava/c16816_g1_i2.p2 GENE.c16816_g1_i2~~c16816_g1_i2.p2  ORF type:complete len:110 (+),score=45.00 c16816_g1_i2:808-1137(+)
MKEFENNDSIQRRGFLALGNLLEYNLDISFIQEHNVINLLVSVLIKFPNNHEIFKWACFLINILSKSEEMKKLMNQMKIDKILSSGKNQFLQNKNLQKILIKTEEKLKN